MVNALGVLLGAIVGLNVGGPIGAALGGVIGGVLVSRINRHAKSASDDQHQQEQHGKAVADKRPGHDASGAWTSSTSR